MTLLTDVCAALANHSSAQMLPCTPVKPQQHGTVRLLAGIVKCSEMALPLHDLTQVASTTCATSNGSVPGR